MKESEALRCVLAQNIRKARAALHITQAKLAIYADISVPYMVDIERCRTWVSDKTLMGIAKALNMEAYELLIPEKPEKGGYEETEILVLQRLTELIQQKKNLLRQNTGEIMDDLVLELIRLFKDTGPSAG